MSKLDDIDRRVTRRGRAGSTQMSEDAGALVEFAKDVREALAHGEDILAHGAEIESDFPDLVAALRTTLNKLEA